MTAQQYKDNILSSYDNMLVVARRILNNEDEAQDAVQDVCRRLWEKCSDIAVPANAGAFCVVTIRNYCLDIIRSQPMTAGEDALTNLAESKADDETDLEESTDMLQRAIDKLDQRPRQVIIWGLQGRSYQQMATALNTTETNVRQVTSRARRQLRQLINEMQSL